MEAPGLSYTPPPPSASAVPEAVETVETSPEVVKEAEDPELQHNPDPEHAPDLYLASQAPHELELDPAVAPNQRDYTPLENEQITIDPDPEASILVDLDSQSGDPVEDTLAEAESSLEAEETHRRPLSSQYP